MAIKMKCGECEAVSQDGIMKHTKVCSANNFIVHEGHGDRPPHTVITFDTPEEQKKFWDGLKGSGGTHIKQIRSRDE